MSIERKLYDIVNRIVDHDFTVAKMNIVYEILELFPSQDNLPIEIRKQMIK